MHTDMSEITLKINLAHCLKFSFEPLGLGNLHYEELILY